MMTRSLTIEYLRRTGWESSSYPGERGFRLDDEETPRDRVGLIAAELALVLDSDTPRAVRIVDDGGRVLAVAATTTPPKIT